MQTDTVLLIQFLFNLKFKFLFPLSCSIVTYQRFRLLSHPSNYNWNEHIWNTNFRVYLGVDSLPSIWLKGGGEILISFLVCPCLLEQNPTCIHGWHPLIKLIMYTATLSLMIVILQLCKNNCWQTAKQDYGLKFVWQKKVGFQKFRQLFCWDINS